MSKFIHDFENNQLIEQIKLVVNSNLNSDYPYYFCSISNSTYDNFRCCFYKEFKFNGNNFSTSDKTNSFYIDATKWSDGNVKYARVASSSLCSSIPHSQINQDLEFTNVSNNESGLIDISSKTLQISNSSTPGTSNDVVSNNTWLFFISAILVLIVIRDFIHYCFRKR